jgi:muramoyltetrapeptide carboxypeptidase
VKLANGLFSESHQFAGTDEVRTKALQELLDDNTVQAIICARGGYGTVRIIDTLDFAAFSKHPKWLIGFSDITVLHTHIWQHYGIATIHAAMAFSFQPDRIDEENATTLHAVLFGENSTYSFAPDPHNRAGTAKATLLGGNLSVLYSTLGSPSDLDTKGCILFLEDLDEYLYHIDRMMMNMKRNGKLSNLAGLVIGGMNDMRDNTIPFGKTAHEIIAEHVAEYKYPVAFGFPAGHEKKNLALVFGTEYALEVKDNSCLLKKC